MPRQRVTTEVLTPTWSYCDLQSGRDKRKKTGDRCRFCKEFKKRGQDTRYMCLLFNVELSHIGDLVQKDILCYRPWKKNDIVDLTEAPAVEEHNSSSIDAQALKIAVQDAIKDLQCSYKNLVDNGIPAETAYTLAVKDVTGRWK